MKIRKDFVTNSSSSSFIIGKQDSDWTVEKVYQIIVNALKQLQQQRREFLEICEKKHIKLFKSYHLNSYVNFSLQEKFDYDLYKRKLNAIEKVHGRKFVNDLTSFCCKNWPEDDCPLIHESYKDFVDFWFKHFYGYENDGQPKELRIYNNFIAPPFAIFDLSNPSPTVGFCWANSEYVFNHKDDIGHTVYSPNTIDKNLYSLDSQEVMWYFGDFRVAIENLDSCENCEDKQWCREYKSGLGEAYKDEYVDHTCHELKKIYKENKYPFDTGAVYLLGKILVRSECGYLPEGVQEALADVSKYYCDHMG